MRFFRKIYRGFSLAMVLALLISGVSIAQAPAGEMKLPEGAIQISPAIPAMGEHWANPKDLPLGPIYLVWQGKVIGIEYMFTLAMLEAVPAGPPSPTGVQAFNYNTPNLALMGQKIDHMTITYMADGHEGFKVPHYDIHFYFISPAERYKIILNIPAPPAVSPVVASQKPDKAERTSAVIPRMGFHWSEPANRSFGPIYITDKNGKDVGLEYTYKHDKMFSQRIPEGPPGSPLIWVCAIDYIPLGKAFNHGWVTYLPQGRGEDKSWRFEFHMYTITPEERAAILP